MRYTNPLAPQIHFVTGKGGVGKSTFACALACHFAQSKLSTLLVQINAQDTHSRYLECPPIGPAFMKVDPYIEAINLTPEESLKEYLLLKIKSKRLHRVLFENPVMRSFFRFMPSLPELNMLGKIWYHAQEKQKNGQPRFARIVVDCPATGHGLSFLQVASVTHRGVQKGPIAQEAAQMEAMVADPQVSRLHIVTLAQDMPVQETIELLETVRSKKIVGLGVLVVNAVWDTLLDAPLRKSVLAAKETMPWKDVAMRRLLKETEQQEQINRVRKHAAGMPIVTLPFEPSGEVELATLEHFANCLEAQIEAEDA